MFCGLLLYNVDMDMQIITSLSNAHVKCVRGLKQKKNRIETGLFIADGDLLTIEALQSGADVAEVLVCESKTEAFSEILNLARAGNVPIVCVTEHVMEKLSDTVSPQGIAALVRLPDFSLPKPKGGLVCLLESVADPGNVGTIIRTADAVGADAVILCGECADAYAPKTVRATMGSIFHLPVVHAKDACEAAKFYKMQGYCAVGTHLHGKDAFDPNVAWQKKTLLVTGSEARGMSAELSELCDVLLKLPMPGAAESLNAAVATGIFAYTWLRLA